MVFEINNSANYNKKLINVSSFKWWFITWLELRERLELKRLIETVKISPRCDYWCTKWWQKNVSKVSQRWNTF